MSFKSFLDINILIGFIDKTRQEHVNVNLLFEAVLHRIALSDKTEFFITNDKKDFNKIAHPGLKVVLAKEVLALL